MALVLLAPAAPAQSSTAQLGLHISPCTKGKAKLAAFCGTYGVYENRATRSGPIIPLNIVVLKAKHPTHRAIAIISGGPGQGAVELAPLIADNQFEMDVTSLRDSYDVVFMDDRGMGRSSQLQCDFAPAGDVAAYFRQIIPEKQLVACRTKLAATADLAQYNTNNAVDDLDDVRAALGYPKLVLSGGSYGTFFSLVYIRRHPSHVESAVLDGVTAPHFQPLPGEPMGAQTALDDLITKCKRDVACNKHFPKFSEHFAALIGRLDKGAIPVTLQVGKTRLTLQLSKEVFVDRLRELLYDPDAAADVPLVVERAYHGDTTPLATMLNLVTTELDQDLAMGAWLSYTCSDWMPFLDERAVSNAAAHSFTGDLRIQAQRHACAVWNVPAMPPSFDDPVRSTVPILMISGSDDPATPPRYAQQALAYLPNAKDLLVRGAGHAPETPCTDKAIVQFVRAQSVKGIDVSQCVAAFTVPHFATSLSGVMP